MASKSIDKIGSHRTDRPASSAAEGTGAQQAPDMSAFTVLRLRKLLGHYSASLSDAGAEEVVTVVRRMAQQATAPVNADRKKGKAVTPFAWDIQGVAEAAATLHHALPIMAEWWTGLFPSARGDMLAQLEKDRDALAQLVEPLTAALHILRFPLGEFKPLPRNQIRRKPGQKPWHVPAVILANMFDRMLRKPDDTELPAFSHGSRPAFAIHEILSDLRLTKPTTEVSAVAKHIERWWGKYKRLPLGVTHGQMLLPKQELWEELMKRRASAPGADKA